MRALRHLSATHWALRRSFDAASLAAIEQAIGASERTHGGEIRFALEGSLSAMELIRGISPRQRALQVFAQLGVWDTAANNGVLIYISWADRDVEIVADRGFNERVSEKEWADVCRRMEELMAVGPPAAAVVAGIHAIGALIARHYPTVDRDELANRPVIL